MMLMFPFLTNSIPTGYSCACQPYSRLFNDLCVSFTFWEKCDIGGMTTKWHYIIIFSLILFKDEQVNTATSVHPKIQQAEVEEP